MNISGYCQDKICLSRLVSPVALQAAAGIVASQEFKERDVVLLCRSALVPGTASWHVSSALSGAPSMHSSPSSSLHKAETFHSCHHWQPLDWQVIFLVKWNIAASFVATEWYNGSLCFSPVIKVLLMLIALHIYIFSLL